MTLSFIRFMLATVYVGVSAIAPCLGNDLVTLWRDSKANAYQAPSLNELKNAESLFSNLYRGETGAEVKSRWRQLGFEIIEVRIANVAFVLLREQASSRLGRGFFAFVPERESNTVLQAPHSFKDLYTGTIGFRLLTEAGFKAGAWNTAPRFYTEKGNRRDADMAHLSDTYFNAFTRAFARHMPNGQLIQLHGFDNAKRRTEQGRAADMIISAANRWPSNTVIEMATCLNTSTKRLVRIFPWDVRELGGTKNKNAAALRGLGHSGFIHLELSKPLRKQLVRDAALRRHLALCSVGGSG